MAIRPIRLFPDSLLSQTCQPVQPFDNNLDRIIGDLVDTLYHSPGVGLAAPQIGHSKQVSVIDVHRSFSKRTPPAEKPHLIILINPEIVEGKGIQTPREGCLSVPDWLANVQRYEYVVVRSMDFKGGERIIKKHGFEALALQHEIDHLNGKLFLDRVVNLKTDLFRRKTYK